MITIPAGQFLMGSDKAKDSQARDDETPQYWVEVDAFQIAKYPVTVAEYALAVRAGAVREPPKPDWNDVTWETQQQHLDHPVVNVSWHDATAYAAWLNTATGQRGWRLPTEAEWEKAARWDPRAAGTAASTPGVTRFDQNRCNTARAASERTSPVGWYPASRRGPLTGASPFGVEEMAGNVWEWTSSIYAAVSIHSK